MTVGISSKDGLFFFPWNFGNKAEILWHGGDREHIGNNTDETELCLKPYVGCVTC